MIVKFMPNQKGGSAKAIDYLLNNRTLEGTAKVLKGDEKLTRDIIKTIDRKQKVTVGVLSFEEENISREQKYQIIDSFESVLMPTLPKDEFNILWVEHTDKNRLELNFVIPKTNLLTGKSIQPFYYAADWKRIDNWKDIINQKFGLSNPKEPSKAQNLSISHQNPRYEQLKELDRELHRLVRENQIQSREELLEHIKSKGVEVTRVNQNFISIKLEGMKRAVRLKDDIYHEEFISIEKLKQMQEKKVTIQKEQQQEKDAQNSLVQRVIYKIYQQEKDTEKRRALIRDFFEDMQREKILQREKIYQLEHRESENIFFRKNAFVAMSGIGILAIVSDAVKAYRLDNELHEQKQHNKEKYLDRGEIEI